MNKLGAFLKLHCSMNEFGQWQCRWNDETLGCADRGVFEDVLTLANHLINGFLHAIAAN